jgi:peptide/nickel transport system permease protein
MLRYISGRLLMLIPVWLGVTLMAFLISRATPGDPVRLYLGTLATPELVEQTREQLGLNDPLPVQYGRFVWNALRGDLGKSIRGQTDVTDEIIRRLPGTLQLTVGAMLIAVVVGVAIGVLAATRRGTLWDSTAMVAALAGLSIPNFWLATILLIIFGVNLRWVSITADEGLKSLILPCLTLALAPAAVLARLTRSSVLEVMNSEFARTARAKGLTERIVLLRHILRNALLPVVTVIGLQAAGLLGGAVLIEAVFGRPGLGQFAVDAVLKRDYPQIQGIVVFGATVYVLINLGIDILYGIIDPRIRYE